MGWSSSILELYLVPGNGYLQTSIMYHNSTGYVGGSLPNQFYGQPSLVNSDTEVLATLMRAHFSQAEASSVMTGPG